MITEHDVAIITLFVVVAIILVTWYGIQKR